MKEALTFDDVLLVPQLSSVLPKDVNISSRLTKNIQLDRKSTRLNSSHKPISYAVFCLKKKKTQKTHTNCTQKILN